MNKLGSISISVMMLLMFSFCSATRSNLKQKVQEKHPFKVTHATYNNVVGDESNSRRIHISIEIDNPKIELDSVFFRNMKTDLKRENGSSSSIFVGILISSNTQKDYILHKNPVEEYGNKAPNIHQNIPFDLEENEAVVSYFYNKETQYYKIIVLKETENNFN